MLREYAETVLKRVESCCKLLKKIKNQLRFLDREGERIFGWVTEEERGILVVVTDKEGCFGGCLGKRKLLRVILKELDRDGERG